MNDTKKVVVNLAVPVVHKGKLFPGVTIWPGANAVIEDAPCDPRPMSEVLDINGNVIGHTKPAPRIVVRFPDSNVGPGFCFYYDGLTSPDIGTDICGNFLQIHPTV